MQNKGEVVHQNAIVKEVSWPLLDNELRSWHLTGYSKWKAFLGYLDISLIYVIRIIKCYLLFYKWKE